MSEIYPSDEMDIFANSQFVGRSVRDKDAARSIFNERAAIACAVSREKAVISSYPVGKSRNSESECLDPYESVNRDICGAAADERRNVLVCTMDASQVRAKAGIQLN